MFFFLILKTRARRQQSISKRYTDAFLAISTNCRIIQIGSASSREINIQNERPMNEREASAIVCKNRRPAPVRTRQTMPWPRGRLHGEFCFLFFKKFDDQCVTGLPTFLISKAKIWITIGCRQRRQWSISLIPTI